MKVLVKYELVRRYYMFICGVYSEVVGTEMKTIHRRIAAAQEVVDLSLMETIGTPI